MHAITERGRQHAVVRMLALRVVEELDVVEHVPSCVVSGWICPPPDPLPFQQLEEALRDGVVVTVAATAHAGFQIVLVQERLPFPAIAW